MAVFTEMRSHPVRFQGQAFIRIGSYKKKLGDYPEKERALWRAFDQAPYDQRCAISGVGDDDVLRLLDYPAYFELSKLPLPAGSTGILDKLAAEGLIVRTASGQWDVMNLGAILFAKQLTEFGGLARKAVRVVEYNRKTRTQTKKEQMGARGYASGFAGMISFINGLLPANELIGQALRQTVPMYPEIAVREIVANALIHQDFFVTGTGPMVEVFDDRMEITNPGAPLIDPDRFLDNPPQSRNEKLAALMRRFGICEERGSGIDKVVFNVEFFQLPAPLFEASENSMRVVLFSHRSLSRMDRRDRIRACYQHACLKYVAREHMTNSTIRQRFGIEDRNIAQASRLIKEAVGAGVIAPYDENAGPRFMRNVPWWAEEGGPLT